ncbi:MAG: YhgE/Pip domain-containing protein [Bacilli bacterium]|nr:YhgE/Pip domain-containing protein [Bacilli bacterium]
MKKNKNKRKVMTYVVIAAVALIPFMYSFFYLKAFWNPYGEIDNIPVAIVNLDKTINDVNRGEDLLKNLEEKDVLDFNVVDEKTAIDGLQDQTYYAIITIPENFTENLENVEEDKQLTTITYTPNQKTNYLASQIISKVMLKVEEQLRANISSEVVTNLSDKITEFPSQVEKMLDGLKQIESGIYSVKNGTNTITEGLNILNNNYEEFDNGIKSSYEGSATLTASLTNLTLGLNNLESGLNDFNTATIGLSTLVESISKLSDSHNQLTTGLNSYIDGVTSVTATYDNLVTSICAEEGDESVNCQTAKDIQLNLDYVSASGNSIKTNNQTINYGLNAVATNSSSLGTINDTIKNIQTNVTKLKSGSSLITSGMKSLESGLYVLSTSSDEVKSGIIKLSEGSIKLQSGVNTLYEKTDNAVIEIDNNLTESKEDINKLTGLDDYVKESVTIKEEDFNQVTEYGIAFAPYFMSLSLWVGALMLFVVLYYDVKDRFKIFSRNNKNKVQRTLAYMVLASSQGLLLGLLLKIGLGFEITNLLIYYGSLILVANAFLLIIEFLIINFDDIGKFIAILFLVLQLASSGGTFPIETVPTFFRSIYNFMPMKYSIGLFKEAIITSESSITYDNIIVVIGILIGTFITIILADIIKKKIKK